MGNFGERLRKFREVLRLSQTEFADAMGTKQQYIGNWEKGRSKISHDNLILLKKQFPQLNMDWLEFGSDPMILSMLISSTMSSVPDNNPIPIPKIEFFEMAHSKELLQVKLEAQLQKNDSLEKLIESKIQHIDLLKNVIENQEQRIKLLSG